MKAVAVAVLLALLAGAAQAAGAVQVSFVKPENFADVRDRSHRLEDNLAALERVLVDVAAPYVADGQTLKIEVLDVDLAGEPHPRSSTFETRVMRGGADWPRITLRWSLEGGASAPRRGEAAVQDMNYLQRIPRSAAYTHLVHERRMLEEWFRSQFAGAKAG